LFLQKERQSAILALYLVWHDRKQNEKVTTVAETGSKSPERFREIVNVLARHDLLGLVVSMGLEKMSPALSKIVPTREAADPQPVRIRRALEELGVTYIKLGQMLATRSDLISPELEIELSQLKGDTRPMPLEVVRRQLATQLNSPVEAIFKWLDEKPFTASLTSQIHEAELLNGTRVIVKVRRVGITETITRDLRTLEELAAYLDENGDFARDYDIIALFDGFATNLRDELNYLKEMQNARRFAHNFAQFNSLNFPHIYDEYTTPEVLVMEKITGMRLTDFEALETAEIEPRVLAGGACRLLLKMAFEDGFFHADLQPANFFVQKDGSLTLIDFGAVGRLDKKNQRLALQMLYYAANADAQGLTEVLLELANSRARLRRQLLEADVQRLLDDFHGLPVEKLSMSEFTWRIMVVLRKHRLALPVGLVMLLRSLGVVDGLARLLHPHINYFEIARDYTGKRLFELLSPGNLWGEASRAGLDTARLGSELPRRLNRMLTDIERRGFEIGLRRDEVESFTRRVETQVNRLILAVILGSLIVGLGSLASIFDLSNASGFTLVLFFIAFGVTLALGIYFAFTILRGPRRK
jgi:ubiquinone biosynthesis protein